MSSVWLLLQHRRTWPDRFAAPAVPAAFRLNLALHSIPIAGQSRRPGEPRPFGDWIEPSNSLISKSSDLVLDAAPVAPGSRPSMLRNWNWARTGLPDIIIYKAIDELEKKINIPDLEVPFNRVRKRLMLPGDLVTSLLASSSGSQAPSLIFWVEMLFLPSLKKRFSELVFVPLKFCSVVGMFSGSASGTSWRLDIVRPLEFFKKIFYLYSSLWLTK